MLKTISAYEARINFYQLLEEVNGGATIIITKHGVPAAQMVPVIERWLEKRKDITLGPGLTIRELIEDGRQAR